MNKVYLVAKYEENYAAYDETRKIFVNKVDADNYAKELENAITSRFDYVVVEEMELN